MQQENRENATGIQAEAKDNSKVNVAKTINIYESSRPPKGIPFQALALPKDYVDRPEIRQCVKSKLIDQSPSRPGTLVVSAIYGLGGVGKSVIASALAHDAEVQGVCSDGVLWITLGQNPDILSFLYGWIQALEDYDYKPTTIESASSHLRSLLYDKKILLVVDDVWKTEHVEPFQVGGKGCRILVTTREAHVPDAERIDMDVMSPAEALELLLSKAQIKVLTTHEGEQARRLIEVVGGLPLAVDLAGAQIADGMTWDELLEDLEAEIAYLESLDRPNSEGVRDEKTRKRLSLKASLNLSLKLLTEDQLRQFAWLGVLPEDVSIQPGMAATLWAIPRKQAGAILRSFRAKALLLSGVQGVGQGASYRLHDLMHDLSRGLLTGEGEKDVPGLNIEFKNAHAILLDRYRQQTRDGQWHTLTDDGYIHSYLTWHMEQSGRIDELHSLLQEVTPEGRNGWYETCDQLGQTANFVTDVSRAWFLAETAFLKKPSQSIALQCRYALVMTSLNSLAKNISPDLMSNLVKHEIWTPAQGITYALQIPTQAQRASAIGKLAPYLPKSILPQALEAARSIKNACYRVEALAALALRIPELWPEALEVARSIENAHYRVEALEILLPRLPKSTLPQALEVARSIEDAYYRVKALEILLPRLPKSTLPQALEVARSIEDAHYRVEALARLAPHIPELCLEALDVALSSIETFWSNEYFELESLTELVHNIPESMLPQALQLTHSIRKDSFHSRVIKILNYRINSKENIQCDGDVILTIPTTSSAASENTEKESLVPEKESLVLSLAAARSIRDDSEVVITLGQLISLLPQSLFIDSLKIVYQVDSLFERTKILCDLIPRLPELKHKVLEDINTIIEASDRIVALTKIVSYMPETLPIALDIARKNSYGFNRGLTLSKLLPFMPELVPEVLQIARSTQSAGRVHILSALIPYQPDLLEEALDSARRERNVYIRSNILSSLVPFSREILPEVLEAIYSFPGDVPRAYALGKLVAQCNFGSQNYTFWVEIIHTLANSDRQDLLRNIPNLKKAIFELGGEEAIVEVFQAIQDISRWWR
jgi:NB-ARC domain/APAF-1 helical domain